MIFTWLARLFQRKNPDRGLRPSIWPTREEMLELPPFDAIGLDRIVEVNSPHEAQQAHDALMKETVVGFDTESKPTFVKGHVSTGPHVAQFATLERTYIFSLHSEANRRAVRSLLAAKSLTKVGFGLNEDLRLIPIKFGIRPKSVIDLESAFAAKGFGRGVGVKVAVAIALKRCFSKSKKASTSNWMQRPLTEKQLLYAANDAYAAIRVHEALKTLKSPLFRRRR